MNKYEKQNLASINKYRKLNGLSPLKAKNRSCLVCNTSIFCTSRRICDNCVKNNRKYEDTYK